MSDVPLQAHGELLQLREWTERDILRRPAFVQVMRGNTLVALIPESESDLLAAILRIRNARYPLLDHRAEAGV